MMLKDPVPTENRSFDQPRIASERSFGFLFSTLFIVIGLWPLPSGRPARLWLLGLAALLLLATLAAPVLLRPLNRLWFRFGLLLGKLVTPVVMGLLFYLSVTPIAVLMRLFGKDVLLLKPDVTAPSYWLPRTPPGPQRGAMRDQF